jgi:type I restriction enzyme S subunit
MRLNYKRLGDYIEPCNEKNDGNVIKKLQGISNRKYFQKAKTNTIGIDLTKYRVVRTGQFAFNRATTRNGDKISIALRHGKDCIVSPSYRIFESKDENILNSEYLMMWFKRPDFDRYARFKSHGSAHEFFDWAEMQEVDLPIPSIEKQREIVKEYNTIVNRIRLNETLNQKLEDTAQALYKHWFVDFEFPNADGEKYKSSGGKMVFNEELDVEIPEGWEKGNLGDLSNQFSGFSFKGDKYSFDEGVSVVRGENVTEQKLRWNTHKKWPLPLEARMEKCFLQENDIVIGMDGSKVGKNWSLISKYDLPLLLAQRVTSVRSINEKHSLFIYHSMLVQNFEYYVSQVQTGTSIPHISGKQISDFPFLIPENSIIELYENHVKIIVEKSYLNTQLNKKLESLKDLLLSKIAKVEIKTALV